MSNFPTVTFKVDQEVIVMKDNKFVRTKIRKIEAVQQRGKEDEIKIFVDCRRLCLSVEQLLFYEFYKDEQAAFKAFFPEAKLGDEEA